jgi:hypothetical protein
VAKNDDALTCLVDLDTITVKLTLPAGTALVGMGLQGGLKRNSDTLRMQRHRRRRATRPRGFPNSQKSPRRAHAGTFVPIPRRRWTPKAAPEDQHLP